MSARNWTTEQRQRQGASIHAWGPWNHSTGPRTAEGKAIASRNGWKGGTREMLRELSRALAAQREVLDTQ